MDLDDYASNEKKDEESPNQAYNQSINDNNRKKEPLNRAPSAAVDPEFHRQAKRLKQKLKFTSRLLWITLAISGLTLILLVIQWVSSNNEIEHMKDENYDMRRGT